MVHCEGSSKHIARDDASPLGSIEARDWCTADFFFACRAQCHQSFRKKRPLGRKNLVIGSRMGWLGSAKKRDSGTSTLSVLFIIGVTHVAISHDSDGLEMSFGPQSCGGGAKCK
jgi:hypothetical protein